MKPAFKLINPTNSSHPIPDQRDEAIALESVMRFNERPGPRVGDWVLHDGELKRIGELNYFALKGAQDYMQLAAGHGSFSISKAGYARMSGALEGLTDPNRLVDTSQSRYGRFWFFHHGYAEAHNAVEVYILTRVYFYVGPQEREV